MSREYEFDWVVRLDDGYAVSAHRGLAQVSADFEDAMRCTEAGAKQILGILQLHTKQRGRQWRYGALARGLVTP